MTYKYLHHKLLMVIYVYHLTKKGEMYEQRQYQVKS